MGYLFQKGNNHSPVPPLLFLSDIHQRVYAFGVELEAEAEGFKKTDARGIVGVNECDEVEGGIGFFRKIAQRGKDFLRVALSLMRTCDGDTDGDAILFWCDEKGKRADGRAVAHHNQKTLDFCVGKEDIVVMGGNHFADMFFGIVFPALITRAHLVLAQ